MRINEKAERNFEQEFFTMNFGNKFSKMTLLFEFLRVMVYLHYYHVSIAN